MDLLTPPGVFRPISDSWLLADAVRREVQGRRARVLDVCTGSGVVAVAAARAGGDTTAVDVSRRALATAWWNGRRHGVRVRVRRGRSFEPVPGERFDVITSNPPYVPSERDEVPTRGLERAWAAGRDGRLVLDDLCDRAPAHLRPGGVLLVVHSSLIDDRATVDRLRAVGLEAAVVERHRGPLGPLMRQQQEAGLIPADVDEEDVVLVRAVARHRTGSP
jgi:release factor glutamine methyltransferase